MDALKKIVAWFENIVTAKDSKKWKVVALCIFGATTFWFFNALNKDDYTTVIKYPITLVYENPPDSLVMVQSPPEKIELDVSGRGWELFRKTFGFKNAPVQIELESPTSVKFLLGSSLLSDIKSQLTDIKINGVLTDSIFFNIEKNISQKIPIQIDTSSISLEENHYMSGDISVIPDSVEIMGPSSWIENNLPDVLLLHINEEDIDATYSDIINTNIFDNELISTIPDGVEVDFEVNEFIEKNVVAKVIKVNFPTKREFQLSDTLIAVSYWTSKNTTNEIDGNDFKLKVDFSDLDSGDSTLSIQVIKYPKSIKHISLDPEKIKVSHGK